MKYAFWLFVAFSISFGCSDADGPVTIPSEPGPSVAPQEDRETREDPEPRPPSFSHADEREVECPDGRIVFDPAPYPSTNDYRRRTIFSLEEGLASVQWRADDLLFSARTPEGDRQWTLPISLDYGVVDASGELLLLASDEASDPTLGARISGDAIDTFEIYPTSDNRSFNEQNYSRNIDLVGEGLMAWDSYEDNTARIWSSAQTVETEYRFTSAVDVSSGRAAWNGVDQLNIFDGERITRRESPCQISSLAVGSESLVYACPPISSGVWYQERDEEPVQLLDRKCQAVTWDESSESMAALCFRLHESRETMAYSLFYWKVGFERPIAVRHDLTDVSLGDFDLADGNLFWFEEPKGWQEMEKPRAKLYGWNPRMGAPQQVGRSGFQGQGGRMYASSPELEANGVFVGFNASIDEPTNSIANPNEYATLAETGFMCSP